MSDLQVSKAVRSVIVTGAASGIGLATAERLLADGWLVTVADLPNSALTDRFADSDACQVVAVDIYDSASVQSLIAAAVSRFGSLSALANIAGITVLEDQKLEDLDDAVFDRVVAVNLRGAFLMCKYAIPHLRAAGGGAIVNMGSVASVRAMGGAAYVSSKHGILGLSRVIASQYAAEQIRCNVVAPGGVNTPMLEIARRKAVIR
ncbi:MAG: SDR family oxidoreductase, partial [Actinomycetota bacterium]